MALSLIPMTGDYRFDNYRQIFLLKQQFLEIMRPHVILYNAVSVDGRVDWFPANTDLFHELASRWPADVHLIGSDTILSTESSLPEENETIFQKPSVNSEDSRPILVIPDSQGRVRNWHQLRKEPYWRDQMVALCSKKTPESYLKYLSERYIDYVIAGEDQVDFRQALAALSDRYDVKIVRVDSGGTLNGVLLKQDLADEINLLIHPYLVGGTTPSSIVRGLDLTDVAGVIQLKLVHAEPIKEDMFWLKYEVVRSK